MSRFLVLAAALALSFAAAAQQYRWVDKDGRVQYGDVPPPGVKATPMRAPSGPAAPAAPAAKAGGKALTPAEQEAAFRQRQQEAQKEANKASQGEREAAEKKENCARARESQRSLEMGGRQSRVDEKGERYYLEDAQIAQELEKARQAVQQSCS
jgi:uncharacterized protein DUF4124